MPTLPNDMPEPPGLRGRAAYLDGVQEGLRQARIIQAAEAQRVVVDEVRHHRRRQRKEAAAKLGGALVHALQAGVQRLLVLLLQAPSSNEAPVPRHGGYLV